jgi:hypothetical protein
VKPKKANGDRLHTPEEIRRAREKARRSDGTVAPLAFIDHLIEPDQPLQIEASSAKRTKR